MCLGSTQSYPDLGPRDTSEEIIKSKYELSDENKRRNIGRRKPLVSFDDQSGDGFSGKGTVMGNGLSTPISSSGNRIA